MGYFKTIVLVIIGAAAGRSTAARRQSPCFGGLGGTRRSEARSHGRVLEEMKATLQVTQGLHAPALG